jgi:hypothetical protein
MRTASNFSNFGRLGKIMWIRAMVLRLESFTKEFAAHTKLNQLPQYKILVKEYNEFALEVAAYEIKFLKRWQNDCKVGGGTGTHTHNKMYFR